MREQPSEIKSRKRPDIQLMPKLAVILLCASLGVATAVQPSEAGDSLRTWNFDADQASTLPKDFVIGTLFDGRPAGKWQVIEVHNAPTPPHVLAQLMDKGAEHAYKVVLVEGTTATDLTLEVSFLAVAGKGDMGGGLIWRAKDDRNYYLTRVNPLEQNIRAYRVVKGVREQLANFNQTVPVHTWHSLRVESRGEHVRVFYDGLQVLDVHDNTFESGRVGVWTKSDAVTYFDNLRLHVLR